MARVEPTVALPSRPLNVIGAWNVIVAKLMTSHESPYAKSGSAANECGKPGARTRRDTGNAEAQCSHMRPPTGMRSRGNVCHTWTRRSCRTPVFSRPSCGRLRLGLTIAAGRITQEMNELRKIRR
jgi:hypothetical protein